MGNLENAKDLGQSIYTKAEVNVDFAHKVSSIAELASLDSSTPTVIVTDTDRGGIFVWSESGTANGGTVFAGSSGYWVRQYDGAVNVKWFGAVGDGVTDDTTAIQNALNVSGTLKFTKVKTYKITNSITYTGQVIILGNGATIKSDVISFVITDGSNSIIKDINFQPITVPYTVIRDSAFAPTLGYSLNGYQPTVNDGDIWGSLTTEQKNQNIGGGILFDITTNIQSNILIENITGNFVNIILKATDDSTVKNCKIKGGKNFAGGIIFWSIDTLAGRRNKVLNCNVSTSSFSGIVYANQYDGQVSDCNCSFNGESGIKTWQGGANTTAHGTQIANNICYANFYDGIDAQATYGEGLYNAEYDNRNSIYGNTTWFNRQTGLVVNGKNNSIKGNVIRGNGVTGLYANYLNASDVSDNILIDNNSSNALTGHHQMVLAGTSVVKNNTAHNPSNNAGYNYYIDGAAIFGFNFEMGGQNSRYLGASVIRKSQNDFLYTPNGSVESNVADCNLITKTGFYQAFGSANLPDGNWYYLQVIGFGNNSPCVQIAYGFVGTPTYRRNYFDSSWTAWVAV